MVVINKRLPGTEEMKKGGITSIDINQLLWDDKTQTHKG